MKIRVRHRLTYRYDGPVFLEPMTVRLRPRCDAAQRLESYSLAVDAEPTGRSDSADLFGNDVTLLWFQDLRDRLEITTDWSVTTLRSDPFDFLITGSGALEIPFEYPSAEVEGLAPYLRREAPDPAVDRFAQDALRGVKSATLPFLSTLTSRTAETCQSIVRDDGDPLLPAETLAGRRGACRDLTVLFLDACRSVGLAARFASGYKAGDEDDEPRHLHAWAEVYLPGAGWRGFDPSLGLAVTDGHVPVAAAPEPFGAAPTAGSFRGSGVQSRLAFTLEVDVEP